MKALKVEVLEEGKAPDLRHPSIATNLLAINPLQETNGMRKFRLSEARKRYWMVQQADHSHLNSSLRAPSKSESPSAVTPPKATDPQPSTTPNQATTNKTHRTSEHQTLNPSDIRLIEALTLLARYDSIFADWLTGQASRMQQQLEGQDEQKTPTGCYYAEAKLAYRRIILRYHPDTHPPDTHPNDFLPRQQEESQALILQSVIRAFDLIRSRFNA